MEWLKITGPAFKNYLASGDAVAVLPLGSIEKHGPHLPMGTDTLNAEYVCREASSRAGALMLPPLAYTFVNEMKASAGTISLSAGTLLSLLEDICDDVARNGIKKIILANSHGGNNYVAMTFIQDLPGRGKDYVVYYVSLASCLSPERREKIKALRKTDVPGGHACDNETDLTLFEHPELVDLDALPAEKSAGQSVQDFDVAPALPHIWWYAMYPDSLAGDPRFPSAERGALIVEGMIEKFAETIAKVRADKRAAQVSASFEDEARNPEKMH